MFTDDPLDKPSLVAAKIALLRELEGMENRNAVNAVILETLRADPVVQDFKRKVAAGVTPEEFILSCEKSGRVELP